MQTSSRRRVLAAAGLTAAALAVSQTSALAHAPKDVAAGTRLAARTNPAVQRITADFATKVIVPKPKTNKAFKALVARAKQYAKAGRIPADNQSQLKWVLTEAEADAQRYLDPAAGENRIAPTTIGGDCTGWWMTPDGFMVTAAHCVSLTKPEERLYFGNQALPKISLADAVAFLKPRVAKAQPDTELVNLATKLFTKFNTENMRLTTVKRKFNVLSPAPGRRDKLLSTPLKLVAQGESYPGEDFALLKLRGAKNIPTVPLGHDVDVRVGDVLYINGFPGLINDNPVLDLRSKLQPSLTEGAYNVKRTSVKGVPYIQSQAPSYKGNSGGPVFSKEGKVIGILIAGSVDQRTGETAENHSFILPVSIVRRYLTAAGVKPAESATTRIYNAALDDFFASRFRAALPKFRQVRALYPKHQYVAAFISDSQKAIAAGKDKTQT